ncbi:GNAT family N-acetyltransferase [Amycolatopsis sp. CA-230715]|uniref:GNAT family N-acetyltransferase n=1 Tax=Amycolatopsis sp. CA-230715 TaxID=2745196 RepID=UPI001C027944
MQIRRATASDVESIVRMLADDQLGATRESTDDLGPYLRAFSSLEADPNQLLMVADDGAGVVGTFQLTIIPGLSHKGSSRGLIEAVRVAGSHRGSGLGTTLMQWAIDESRRRGCRIVQLTSNASREDAHRFYERLGFAGTHVGFKLVL